MNRCVNYSSKHKNKLCRRKIFDKDKKFCDNHIPINYEEVNETGCSICGMEDLKIEDLKVLKCNHVWHRDCINRWFNKNYSCPLCRNTI
jgi:hypothetical protein